MCSIPGLPTPGSEVTVHVTRVNLNPDFALVELWGDIDHERRHAYRQMKREIQIPKVTFCESDGNPGDLCLAYLNEAWHRARITSRHGGNYNVFFIDEGTSHIATNSTLAWGQKNSFLLPPEVEFCVLANVSPLSHENKWSPRATEFLKSLYGKTLSGVVQDVLMPIRTILLDIPSVSKHMYEVGFARRIPADQFRVRVLSYLHLPVGEGASPSEIIHPKSVKPSDAGGELKKPQRYLYPELLMDILETVEVTEVIDALQIYCRLSIFSQELKKLSEQIQEYFEGRSAFSKGQPQVSGSPCAVKGSDGKWYRSVIQQDLVSDGAVEVMHVDYGRTEFVHADDIRPLDDKFIRMPVVTYLCSLHGMEEKGTGMVLDQVEYLKSVLLHRTVLARFESYDMAKGVYRVTVYPDDDTVSLNSLYKERISQSHKDSSLQNDKSFTIYDKTLKDFCNPFDLDIESLQGGIKTLLCSEGLPLNLNKEDSSPVKMPSSSTTQVTKECSRPETQVSVHIPLCYSPVKENAINEHLFPKGTSMEVKVSYIDSAGKFWCQLAENSNSLIVLMQDMQCFYESVPPRQPVEPLCAALHPDNGMWYRARIVANHHSPLVDVQFVDYGHTRKVPLQDLRPIHPAFLALKAQAFQCCLHNPVSPAPAAWTDVATAEFHRFIDLAVSSNIDLKCTINAVTNDTQGTVLNVVDIETPFQSACKLLTQKGTGDATPFKDPSLTTVVPDAYNYSTHNIEVGGKERVLITYSGGVSHFCGQLERNSRVLEELNGRVQLFSQRLTQGSVCPLVQNTVCFAKYTDNQWYRGQIKAEQPNSQVLFVDYGETLTVNESDILPFPAEASAVRSVPVQAISFGLHNVPAEVSPKVNSWFENYSRGHYFTISVVAKVPSGKLIVELYDGTTNINVKVRDMLEEERLIAQSSSVKGILIPNPTQTQETEPSVHSCLERKTQENASVHSANGEQGTVGQPTSLSPVSQSKPAGSVAGHEKQSGGISRVTDLPPRSLTTGLVAEVYVSQFNSPSSLFVQLKKEEDDIYSLVDRLNGSQSSCEAPVDLKDLRLGDLVNAEYPEDSSWYRAAVRGKRDEDGTVDVEFIDFGNEATISCLRVRQLDRQFAEFPRFSIPCVLEGASKRGKWDHHTVSMFKQVTEKAEKTFACTFIKDTGSIWEVSLEDDGLVLSEALAQQCQSVELNGAQLSSPEQSSPLQYKKHNISVGQTKDVYASCIVGPHFFWCQCANSDELDKITKLAQEVGKSAQEGVFAVDALGPGSPCLALFAEDEQWYRAQVIRKTGDAFTVVFVDYGNESEVEGKSLRSAPRGLMESTPQAFLCSLEGYEESQGSWEDRAADQLYELLVDRPLRVTVRNMDVHTDSQMPHYMVKVECDELSVNEKMGRYWKISTTKETLTTSSNPHPYEGKRQRNSQEHVVDMSESGFSSSAGRKLDDATVRSTVRKF